MQNENNIQIDEFFSIINVLSNKIEINITKEQAECLLKYMQLLLEWNEKINLTAITEVNDVILKHFIDSLTINKYINKNSKIIDVGTGAGFPGIPVSIIREDCNVVLMDSLNKRINFLNEVVKENNIKNIETIHARAEELAKNKQFREKFNVAVSRAVASLNVLVEYLLPFVKVGGYCICMKGSNIEDEIKDAENAIKILGGQIEKIENFNLPESDIGRNIIIIKKIKQTPSKYPRKAGTPSKEPLK